MRFFSGDIKIESYCAGITKYAAEALGDVVYAALPDEGTDLRANSECGALGMYGIC